MTKQEHPTDKWTPEGWTDSFVQWKKFHQAALDMRTSQASEMMEVWKGLWAKPVKENGRIISYYGLRPSLDELMDATEMMVQLWPETAWVAMFKLLTHWISQTRRREAVKEAPTALAEEIDENKGGLAAFDLQEAMAKIGRPDEASVNTTKHTRDQP